MKKTSVPKHVKITVCIKCYTFSRLRPINILRFLSDRAVGRCAVAGEDLKLYWKSEKRQVSKDDQ